MRFYSCLRSEAEVVSFILVYGVFLCLEEISVETS